MAAQQGFIYEQNTYDYLKPLGFVPIGFTPAGAGHDQPDLMLLFKGQEVGCELKITSASAGSLVLKYDMKRGWGFGDIKKEEKEKLFIKDLANEVKLFDTINKKWKDIPYKIDRKDQNKDWKETIGKLSGQQRYKRDLNTFEELKGKIPSIKIEQYYAKKKTYYVNVGTHGFFLMGNTNPFNLGGIPKFSDAITAKYRARVQNKGGGNYQFTFEMSFSALIRSPYNIAPCSRTDVRILTEQAKLPFVVNQ
jgi:hypothetical protein